MLIIAPCSSQKAVTVHSRLHADAFRAKTLNEYTKNWVARVRAAQEKFLPVNVYTGQGIAAVREAAETIDAEMHILSAGLSMVSAKRRIPGYDLTVGGDGPRPFDNIAEHVKLGDWWRSLNRAFGYYQPLAKLIKEQQSQVIIALPASYLLMVSDELTALSISERRKLRIIVSTKTSLASELAEIAIRYDQRLNAIEGAPRGANTSFVQRALLHLCRLLSENARITAVASQQTLVDRTLGQTTLINTPSRRRLTDDQLTRMIELELKRKIVGRSTLLKIIRQEKNVACEQNRFGELYDQVLASRK